MKGQMDHLLLSILFLTLGILKDYNFMPTLRRTAPSGSQGQQERKTVLLKQEQHRSHLPFQINRPGTLAQMKVVEAMSEGPRAQKTAQLQALDAR